MPYGNYQNTPDARRLPQRESVNTSGVIFRNPEQGTYLNVTYWDSFLGMEMGRLTQEALVDFRNANPPDVRQVIGYSDIAAVYGVCKEVLDSLNSSSSFTPVGVRISAKKAHIVEISDGSNIGRPNGLYLVIYKNLDQSNRTTEMFVYPFQKKAVIRKYDHLAGTATEDASCVQEFREFVTIIKEAMKAFTNAQAHAIKKAKHSETMSGLKMLAAISGKCGVDPLQVGVRCGTGKNGIFYCSSVVTQPSPPSFDNPSNYTTQPTFTMGTRNTPFETPVDTDVDVSLEASQLQEVSDLPF